MNLTSALVLEWVYRLQERLGMMAEDRKPAPWQIEMAEKEANDWLEQEIVYRELTF